QAALCSHGAWFQYYHLIITNMSSNALAAISPFVSQMDSALRTFAGFDLKQWISNLDIATVGIVMLVAALGFLLFDLIGYKFAPYSGNAAGYQPFGRNLLTGAAEAWQNRDNLGLDPYLSGVRGRSLDINKVSHVLDAISTAVLEWESPILSTAASTTHNTITHPKF
ncbi:unnamed protein product, partial [Meganyctiphanes norvegica]